CSRPLRYLPSFPTRRSSDLFPRLLAGGGVGENSRRREVGKNAREPEVLAFAELLRKAIDVGGSDAQAVHARVNFQVEGGVPAAAAGGTLEQRQLIAAMDNGREVVRERTERNLGPDRPSCFTAGTFLFAWHVPSMEQRVHPAAGKCQFTTTAPRGKTARWAAARKRQHLVAAGWSGPGSSRWGALRGP